MDGFHEAFEAAKRSSDRIYSRRLVEERSRRLVEERRKTAQVRESVARVKEYVDNMKATFEAEKRTRAEQKAELLTLLKEWGADISKGNEAEGLIRANKDTLKAAKKRKKKRNCKKRKKWTASIKHSRRPNGLPTEFILEDSWRRGGRRPRSGNL